MGNKVCPWWETELRKFKTWHWEVNFEECHPCPPWVPVMVSSECNCWTFVVLVATLNGWVFNFLGKVNRISSYVDNDEKYMITCIYQGKWKIIGSKGQDHEVCSSQLLWSEKHYRYHYNRLSFSSQNITIVKHYNYHCKSLLLPLFNITFIILKHYHYHQITSL